MSDGPGRIGDILDEFAVRLPLLEACGSRVERLLSDLLKTHGIPIHSVTHRVKSPDSLRDKLARPGKDYGALDDVTDLLGVRVITYFGDQIDLVTALIETEFDCLERHSVDKRKALGPDQFGYRSVHKVARLGRERLALAEYSPYQSVLIEIQVRSILEHAWAEIEHDLGYKAPGGVPAPLRRRFSKLSALLELADDEFERLRDDAASYSRAAERLVVEEPSTTSLDQVTLAIFVANDPTYTSLSEYFAEALGMQPNLPLAERVADRVRELEVVGVRTIEALTDALLENADAIRRNIDRVSMYHRRKSHRWASSIILYYLAQMLAARREPREETTRLLGEMSISLDVEDLAGIVRALVRGESLAPWYPTTEAT